LPDDEIVALELNQLNLCARCGKLGVKRQVIIEIGGLVIASNVCERCSVSFASRPVLI
jgi:hypothetical protein